ncbi:MAG: ATP-dependent Clp protease adaptor ClpS [Bacteroidota bacterium]|nr:ATP-dependent Clp protease adaptor ClpS [Bacteroidota bacterium]MBU1423769.1 ATP-dependent Clp protease adaptor ClpS [Bacteroidota bacterium]MDI6778648.1 ATP-dependent Clp protease adaptor ClpS [Bacteroidota bacterium]
MDIKPLDEVEQETTIETQTPAKVILFNDEVHTFDEVIYQLIKAIRCDFERAKVLTNQVHHYGKAIVFGGELAKCIQVSSILEEIELRTQIEY